MNAVFSIGLVGVFYVLYYLCNRRCESLRWDGLITLMGGYDSSIKTINRKISAYKWASKFFAFCGLVTVVYSVILMVKVV